jgi:putative transposase
MVQYRRSRVAGGSYFFTVNLRDRRSALLVEYVNELRQIVADVKSQYPFVTDAMVVLPDHLHAVWTLPPGDANYAARLRLVKARFTRQIVRRGVDLSRDDRGEYDLWQKRYWEHTIRDDRDFEAHVNYVHINPVKHGYAKRAVEWPHSTIHRYVKEGRLPASWATDTCDGTFGE